MMKFSVVLAIFAALAMHAIFADETIYVSVTPAPSSETTTEMATTKTESSSMIAYFFSYITSGYGTLLVASVSMVVTTVASLAVAAVASPPFGRQLCHLFSTCDTPFEDDVGYSDFNLFDSGYQKSTAEKSESALQALTSAYEKYGHGDISGGSNHHADSEESDLQNNK